MRTFVLLILALSATAFAKPKMTKDKFALLGAEAISTSRNYSDVFNKIGDLLSTTEYENIEALTRKYKIPKDESFAHVQAKGNKLYYRGQLVAVVQNFTRLRFKTGTLDISPSRRTDQILNQFFQLGSKLKGKDRQEHNKLGAAVIVWTTTFRYYRVYKSLVGISQAFEKKRRLASLRGWSN